MLVFNNKLVNTIREEAKSVFMIARLFESM